MHHLSHLDLLYTDPCSPVQKSARQSRLHGSLPMPYSGEGQGINVMGPSLTLFTARPVEHTCLSTGMGPSQHAFPHVLIFRAHRGPQDRLHARTPL
jgi:hypothetical protein